LSLDPFTVQPFTFLFQDDHRCELIRADLVEADSDAQLQRRAKVNRETQQQTGLRGLSRIQLVQRAVITAATVVGRVRTETRVAELFAAQRPVNQEPQGGPLRPLRRC